MKRSLRIAFATGLGLLALLCSTAAWAVPSTGLVISEIMFEPTGNNANRQWVELYNGTGAPVNLATYSLGWGRQDYTQGIYQLVGIIPDGQTWVVGGPTSDANNGSPSFDDPNDFNPNLRLGDHPVRTDGIALFDVVATSITPTLAPIHAVIYGLSTSNTLLLDESGAVAPSPLFFTDGGFPEGNSIEFFGADTWLLQSTPTPNSVPSAIPEPGTAAMVFVGLLILSARQRRSRS